MAAVETAAAVIWSVAVKAVAVINRTATVSTTAAWMAALTYRRLRICWVGYGGTQLALNIVRSSENCGESLDVRNPGSDLNTV